MYVFLLELRLHRYANNCEISRGVKKPKPYLSIVVPPIVKNDATPIIEDDEFEISSDSPLSSESDLSESDGDYYDAFEKLYVASCSRPCSKLIKCLVLLCHV